MLFCFAQAVYVCSSLVVLHLHKSHTINKSIRVRHTCRGCSPLEAVLTSFGRELHLLLEAGGWTAQVHAANTACHLILYEHKHSQLMWLYISVLFHKGGNLHTHSLCIHNKIKPCI